MDDYQKFEARNPCRYYVYLHVDPDVEAEYEDHTISNQVIYVGMGQGARAWTFGNSVRNKMYGHRSEDHYAWYLDKERRHSVEELVHIYCNKLSRKEALALEKEVIQEFDPVFNKPMGRNQLKLTPSQFNMCKQLREDGFSYSSIATEVGVSAMTVYRALNGQTKNIGDGYGE